MVDLKKDRVSEFRSLLQSIKSDMINMSNAVDTAAKRTAVTAYKEHVTRIQKEFAYEVNEFKLRGNLLLRKPWQTIKLASKEGWDIYDSYFARNVVNVAKTSNSNFGFVILANAGIWV